MVCILTAKRQMLYVNVQMCTPTCTYKQLTSTSYPFGVPGPGLGGFQVTLISDEEMLWAFTSEGASFGSVKKATGKWWQSRNAQNYSLCTAVIPATTNTNSPPSAEWMMTTLLNGPSPLLLYTPTFTSNGVRGGKVSSLYLYIVESAEVTIFSFQPRVPLARNATMYPKPSPFWNSSDTGWKHWKENNNHPRVAFNEIKSKLVCQHFSSVTKGALFAFSHFFPHFLNCDWTKHDFFLPRKSQITSCNLLFTVCQC